MFFNHLIPIISSQNFDSRPVYKITAMLSVFLSCVFPASDDLCPSQPTFHILRTNAYVLEHLPDIGASIILRKTPGDCKHEHLTVPFKKPTPAPFFFFLQNGILKLATKWDSPRGNCTHSEGVFLSSIQVPFQHILIAVMLLNFIVSFLNGNERADFFNIMFK